MTVIDGYPARSMWLAQMTEFYLPEVNRRLVEAGLEELDFQENYGGSIVTPSGVLEGLRLGLGDMGVVTTIFHASELPSQAISAVTPFISSNAGIVARAVDEIANEFPDMRAEFATENQVYLATGVVLDTYQVFSNRPINTLSDMAGMKIAGAGYNLRYLEGLDGAVGVRGGLTDFYNMVQTGVTEGAMLWPEAANTFAIAEVAPYMLRANLGAVNTKTLSGQRGFLGDLVAGSAGDHAGGRHRIPRPHGRNRHVGGRRIRGGLRRGRRHDHRPVVGGSRSMGRGDAQHRAGMGG